MNLTKKIVTVGVAIGCLTMSSSIVSAGEKVDMKTYYNDIKEATVYNHDDSGMIHVVDVNDLETVLFRMKTTGEYVYTTANNLNVRISPNIGTLPYAALPLGTKLLLVGESNTGWGLVQIDGVNYFVWDEFLTNEKPDEVIEEFNLTDYVYDEYKQTTTESPTQEVVESQNSLTSLGVWNITGYCPCSQCCGVWSGCNTASGAKPTSNHTLATNELPFGTQLLINGIVYTVEDRGGSPYYPWADIYFDSHEQADAWGLQQIEVFLIN